MDDLIPSSDMKTHIPGTSDQYWATLRHYGKGPEYVNLGGLGGRKIHYRRAAVEAWLESRRFTRTDRPVTADASRSRTDRLVTADASRSRG
jgi:hypothetical protein